MLLVVFKSSALRRYQVLRKGLHFIPVAVNEVPLFVRKDRILPLCRTCQCTDEMDTSMFEMIAYADTSVEYRMYSDDGVSKNYNRPDSYVSFAIRENNGVLGAVADKTIVKLSLF